MIEPPSHTPVLLDAVVELLRPAQASRMLDCTVGLGGHSGALLAAAGPDAQLIAIDCDAQNLRLAKQRLSAETVGPAVRYFHANFSQITDVLAAAECLTVDALLADIGVASTHLDDPARGMSFQTDGPLDMRMDVSAGRTAADVVNQTDEASLADVLYHNAEERMSRRIAREIVAARRVEPIRTTLALAEIVSKALGGRRGRKIHPATRTFQALRIEVNNELGGLDALLAALPDVLSPGGRAAIISFHSLEDRRVKRAFVAMKSAGLCRIITAKPRVAADTELRTNPRSRSAKLRCVERQ